MGTQFCDCEDCDGDCDNCVGGQEAKKILRKFPDGYVGRCDCEDCDGDCDNCEGEEEDEVVDKETVELFGVIINKNDHPCKACSTGLNAGESPCWKCGTDNPTL